MKTKTIPLIALFAFACNVNAADSAQMIESSKPLDWSATSSWVDGVVSTSATDVTFAGAKTEINVNSTVASGAHAFKVGANQEVILNIADGKTFSWAFDKSSASDTGIIGENKNTSVIYLRGNGTANGQLEITKATVYFQLDKAKAGSIDSPLSIPDFSNGAVNNCNLIFDGHYTGKRINTFNNSTFTICENSSYTNTGSYMNLWSGGVTMNIMKNATYKTATNYLNVGNVRDGVLNLHGNLIISCGSSKSDTQVYSLAWANANIYAGATIKETGDYGTYIAASGVSQTHVQTGVAKGALEVSSIYFADTATLKLDSSDTFKVGGNDQIDSEFLIFGKNMKNKVINSYKATTFTLDNNVDNNIGSLIFYTGSSARLQLHDTAKLLIKSMSMISDEIDQGSGEIKVIIENLGLETLFIGTDVADKITSGDVVLYASDGTTALVNGEGGYDLSELTQYNNVEGYWLNAYVAVPEPAQWAMIFGAIALGFVAYRRKK